jgi:hypothetical protein
VSCPTATDCTAVGSWEEVENFGDFTSIELPLVESFNGTSWSMQPLSEPSGLQASLASVSCPTTGACAAVGSTPLLGSQQPIVATLGVGKWTVTQLTVPSNAGSTALTAVSCPTSNSCTAVGLINAVFEFVSPLLGPTGPGFETAGDPVALEWQGSRVTADAPLPLPSGAEAAINSVSCPAPATCGAVGAGGAGGGGTAGHVVSTPAALIEASAR